MLSKLNMLSKLLFLFDIQGIHYQFFQCILKPSTFRGFVKSVSDLITKDYFLLIGGENHKFWL